MKFTQVSCYSALLLVALEASAQPASQPPKIPLNRTRVVLLGTGQPAPDPDRSGPATAIVVDDSALWNPCLRSGMLRPIRPPLKNTRTSGPSGYITLQERRELVGNCWKLPAAIANLIKVQGHLGIDKPAHDYSSVPARRQCKGGDDGDPFSSLYKGNLRLDKIHNHCGLREHAGLRQMLVDELLPTPG